MRGFLLLTFLLAGTCCFSQTNAVTENVILVTFDGYRWQELFGGEQKDIVATGKFVKDSAKLNANFWDESPEKRREKLMPFFWHTIASKGQIYGNKKLGNNVHISNLYKFSFPGYNEIFSGHRDSRVNSNNYGDNPNYNIFDFLSAQKGFENKMAVFGTWDAFPKIINSNRNHVPAFVDMKPDTKGYVSIGEVKMQSWNTTIPAHNGFGKEDTTTYHFAKEYLKNNHPRFAFIGFDETDDYAHGGRYDAYLGTAQTLDRYMEDLWNFIQSDPVYKDKTTIIITCDHGRGSHPVKRWCNHGVFNLYSTNTWIAAIGAGIEPKGEIKEKMSLHNNQIAATIASLLGYTYNAHHYSGKPIKGIVGK